jgi:hypothetical protein
MPEFGDFLTELCGAAVNRGFIQGTVESGS